MHAYISAGAAIHQSSTKQLLLLSQHMLRAAGACMAHQRIPETQQGKWDRQIGIKMTFGHRQAYACRCRAGGAASRGCSLAQAVSTHELSPTCMTTCGLLSARWSRVSVLLRVWPTSPMSPMRSG